MCHWWRHRGMFTSPPSRPKSRVWPTWVFAPLTCVVGLWSGSRFYRVSKASLEQGFVYLQATRQEWCTMRNSIANAWYIRSRPVLLVLCCSREVLADPTPLFSPTNIFAPASTPAHSIFGLSLFVLAVTGAIFAIVFSLLVYAVAKFRGETTMAASLRRCTVAIRLKSPGLSSRSSLLWHCSWQQRE